MLQTFLPRILNYFATQNPYKVVSSQCRNGDTQNNYIFARQVLLALAASAAAEAEAVPEADAGYFGYGGYGYPGYSGLGYARPLLASAYPANYFSPYNHFAYSAAAPAITHAGPAFAPYAPIAPAAPVAHAAVAAPLAYNTAPAAIAAPAAHIAYNTVDAPVAHAAVAAPLAYNTVAAPVAHAAVAVPVDAPAVTASQFHSQDEFGNYDYSYSNINSAKREYGNALTGVTGSYSYVDGLGATQRVDYVADDHGFRATGTNFPTTAATLGLHRRRRSVIVDPVAFAPTVSVPAGHEAVLTRIQLNPGTTAANLFWPFVASGFKLLLDFDVL